MADFRPTVPGEKLEWALHILVEAHTRDDSEIGFVVDMGALPPEWIDRNDYVKAWEIVRMQIGRNVNPSPTPA